MDLDTKPVAHPDLQPEAARRRVAKAVGLVAVVIIVLAIALFIGFNAFYVGQSA